jgi:hypothetical protein
MVEQRTTIRQRLDLAQLVLVDDLTYRHALQIHHYTVSVMDRLSRTTRRKVPKRSAQYLSSLYLLYSAENRLNGASADIVDMGGSTGVSVHFLRYAASKLPEGPQSDIVLDALRNAIKSALRRWEQRNPGVVAVPGSGRRAGQTV